MKNLIKQVQNNVFGKNLWERDSKIVLGVSGGPDSVCMLDVFAKLSKKYGFSLIIAHVNYHLRGQDSIKDEKFVAKLAEKYKLPLEILDWNGKTIDENSLRNVRYEFFEKIRKENKFDSIAVAHNKNDQIETFLMRILRGSGLSGLSAIKWRNGNIIRPLLGTNREEIIEHLKQNSIVYRTDKTNKKNLFLRNKIRNKLIPQLEKEYNPAIIDTIFNSVMSIAEDYSFLSDLTTKSYSENNLSVKKILALHPSLQKMAIRNILEKYKQDLKNIDSKHIAEILKILNSTKGKNQTLTFQGLKLIRKGDKVIISCL
jgi:tRNA(Ile)-lysidine synthase